VLRVWPTQGLPAIGMCRNLQPLVPGLPTGDELEKGPDFRRYDGKEGVSWLVKRRCTPWSRADRRGPLAALAAQPVEQGEQMLAEASARA